MKQNIWKIISRIKWLKSSLKINLSASFDVYGLRDNLKLHVGGEWHFMQSRQSPYISAQRELSCECSTAVSVCKFWCELRFFSFGCQFCVFTPYQSGGKSISPKWLFNVRSLAMHKLLTANKYLYSFKTLPGIFAQQITLLREKSWVITGKLVIKNHKRKFQNYCQST